MQRFSLMIGSVCLGALFGCSAVDQHPTPADVTPAGPGAGAVTGVGLGSEKGEDVRAVGSPAC